MKEEQAATREMTCIIIPTYNNDHALASVIQKVLSFSEHVIVVNDGSTDRTAEILAGFPEIKVLEFRKNKGKGMALREAFRHAISQGYRYAITIDSDGQHFPEDIPAFTRLIETEPDSMILGSRNMAQAGVPGTSSFGHKFSIFWFRVETGLKVEDVQTGFRLYPLERVRELKRFYTSKYEFEVEVLVRLAWHGVSISSVPVQVYYAPKESRVTHFRKFRDFTRVSIVNSILVFIALFWARPVGFFRKISKKSARQFFREYIINSKDSNSRLAASVSLGLFIGVTPIWGWQIVTTLGLSHLLKLNKFVAVTASNISLPPMMPIIIFLSYMAGGWVMGASTSSLSYSSAINLDWIRENLIQYLVGSLVFGFSLALVFGPVTYFLLQKFRKNNG